MNVDSDLLLTEICRFVVKRDSGIIRVLRSGREPMITIGILGGRIVTARCGTIRGRAAIDKIRAMEDGKLHVQYTKFHTVDADLPETGEILSLLGGTEGLEPVEPASLEPEIDGRFVDKAFLSDGVLPMLRRYIGPMADFVLDDELAALSDPLPSTEVPAFITKLADNIKDPDKRGRFEEDALGTLLP